MRAIDTCIAALDEQGIKVDVKLSRAVAERINGVIENAGNRNVDIGEAIKIDMEEFGVQVADMRNAVKRNASLNAEARMTMRSYIDTHWADDPAEGMRTMLTGVMINRPGAKDAVSVLQAQIFDTFYGGMVSRLSTPVDGKAPLDYVKPQGVLKTKNPYEDEVRTIMYHMDQAEPDEGMWAGKHPAMVKAARILLDVQEAMRKDANAVGSHWTAKLDNHTTHRAYDGPKMREAGFEKWAADMREWLDMEKTKIPEDQLEAVLLRHFNQEVSGERISNPNSLPESDAIPAGMGNLSKAMAQSRVFHFKDAAAEIAFADKYARGQLLESIAFNLELGAQRIGLMKRFGPNAKANFDAIAKDIGYDLTNSTDAGAPKKLTKFETKMKGVIRSHWPMVDGSMFVPESHTMAKANQTYRSIKMWSQLGGAVLAAVADIPIYASRVSYSGGSYIGGIFEGMGAVFKGTNPEKMRLAAELGVIADNMRNTAMSRFDVDSVIPGGTSRITEKFFNLSLLTPWTDRLRVGFSQARSHSLALQKGKKFKSLDEGEQRQLAQYNINEAEWDVIRQGADKAMDGRNYLTPEAIGDLDDSVISTYLKAIGKADNKANQARYRNDIKDRLKSMFNNEANNAALVPDAGTRGMMLQGQRAGTVVGEGVRNIGMYKSFPIAIMRQIMGTEMYGYKSGLVGEQGVNMPASARMARMIVMSTVFGAVAMTAKEIASGKEPTIADPDMMYQNMMRSFLQGGALGLYGDFLIGETKNRYGSGPISTLIGPAGSDFDAAVTGVNNIWAGLTGDKEFSESSADGLKYLLRQVPGNNLFYAKMGFDYLFIHSLMELTDPGSLRKMEQQKMEDMNQQYIFPPSRNNLVN